MITRNLHTAQSTVRLSLMSSSWVVGMHFYTPYFQFRNCVCVLEPQFPSETSPFVFHWPLGSSWVLQILYLTLRVSLRDQCVLTLT